MLLNSFAFFLQKDILNNFGDCLPCYDAKKRRGKKEEREEKAGNERVRWILLAWLRPTVSRSGDRPFQQVSHLPLSPQSLPLLSRKSFFQKLWAHTTDVERSVCGTTQLCS